MAKMGRKEPVRLREPPQNCCFACGRRPHWVPSLEAAYREVPAEGGGVWLVPIVWACPVARGEEPG